MDKLKQLPIELSAPLVVILVSIVLSLIMPGCIILLLPLCIATVGLSLFRVWSSRRQARAVVKETGADLTVEPTVVIDSERGVGSRTMTVEKVFMDSAVCWKASNGGVLIKKRTAHNWFALIFLGLVELGLVTIAVSVLVTGRSPANGAPMNLQSLLAFLVLLAGLILVVGIPLVVLVRVMRIPSIHVNVNSDMIEIGRGSSARQIPFANIERVIVSAAPATSVQTVLGIGVMLDDGVVVTLGTVSGENPEMAERAYTIALWIASATGASGNDSQSSSPTPSAP